MIVEPEIDGERRMALGKSGGIGAISRMPKETGADKLPSAATRENACMPVTRSSIAMPQTINVI